MTLAQAALWVTGVTLLFLSLVSLAVSLRESAWRDVFGQLVCQVAAYSAGLFAILRFYGPEASIRQFLAVRRTHPGFYPVALLLGVALALPANAVFELVHRISPDLGSGSDVATLFAEAGTGSKALMGLAIVVLGPVIEEVLFRGALFGPMMRAHHVLVVVFGTGAYFALVHLDLHAFLPILLVGSALGYVRARSGSLGPPIVMHAAFNAVPLCLLLLGLSSPKPDPSAEVPILATVLSSIGVVVLLCVARILGRYDQARVARVRDYQ